VEIFIACAAKLRGTPRATHRFIASDLSIDWVTKGIQEADGAVRVRG
jgi:hypothetical protein